MDRTFDCVEMKHCCKEQVQTRPATIRLTKDEWDRFTASLDRPAREPSEATKKAAELFRQGRDEGDKWVW